MTTTKTAAELKAIRVAAAIKGAATRKARSHVATSAELAAADLDVAADEDNATSLRLANALSVIAIDGPTTTNVSAALGGLDVSVAALTPRQMIENAFAGAISADAAMVYHGIPVEYEAIDESASVIAAVKASRKAVAPEGSFIYVLRHRGQKEALALTMAADRVGAIGNVKADFPNATLAVERVNAKQAQAFMLECVEFRGAANPFASAA